MRIKLALAVAFLIAIALLFGLGFYEELDAHAVQTWIRRAGPWGGAAFVLAHAFLQPLGVRSLVFLLSAPLIWEPVEAAVLSWLGAVVASALTFGFARYIARDWAQERAPERIRRLDDRLERNGFRTVTLLRLVFFTTPLLQLGLGVSRVRFAPFLVGTAVGVLPFTILMTLFGTQLSTFFWRILS